MARGRDWQQSFNPTQFERLGFRTPRKAEVKRTYTGVRQSISMLSQVCNARWILTSKPLILWNRGRWPGPG